MGGHHPERGVRWAVPGYDLRVEGDGSEGQHLHGVAGGARAQRPEGGCPGGRGVVDKKEKVGGKAEG